ncbi:MAG: SpoIVB peptidase precursor [Pelotomaculum sp. PtaU1.Bin035]|nr:MAG: SpoIVB peptidase precursor [Pelotomaculum sp. PtaU1.Bin035]
MRGKKRGVLCGFLFFLSGVLVIQGYLFPIGRHSVAVGEPLKLNFPAPIERNLKARIHQGQDSLLKFNSNTSAQVITLDSDPVAAEPGQIQMRLSLFGLIPLKDMVVSIVPQINVIPGGQSIGVLLHSQGVVVMGHSAVEDPAGNKVNPAVDAGICDGDIILKIDAEDIKSEGQVRDMVARAGTSGQPLELEVKRGEEIFFTKIIPVYCKDNLRYRIGLFVRDNAAGLGTLTYYEPESMTYGALGHIITDAGTEQPIELSDGRIVGASVQAIHRGKRGQPGEKIGIFQNDKQFNGTITRNTRMGIFGYLQQLPVNANFAAPIPVAMANQIHEGPAEVLTVLNEDKVDKFTVEILKLNLQAEQEGKGMIIKITDQRLLEQTGGIIQGMSGSPIIQEDKLVGAITHVFVNDPTKGYGVPAEWMLREAGMLHEEKEINVNKAS